jgi:parallel beta-helix repeat protein
MKKTVTLSIGILLFFSMFTVFFSNGICTTATSKTVYVGGNGPGNYTLIQGALDNVTAGDTVFVFSGTYHEHIVIATPVTLIGEEKTSTIIDGNNEEYVVTLEAGKSNLSGFTITHSGTAFPSAGVYIKSNQNTVSGNILTGNFYGIRLLDGTEYNIIQGNEIIDNMRCGVYFSRSSNNILTGNIVSNHPFNGFGLYEFSNNNTLLDNVLSHNNFTGINIRDSFNTHIENNHILENQVSLHVPPPEYSTMIQGNVFSGNTIDRQEEQSSLPIIGIVFACLVVIVFFVLKKWRT